MHLLRESDMISVDQQEAKIAMLEAQVAELTAHIPRMLTIMLQMQAHLETQQAAMSPRVPVSAPAPQRRVLPPRPPFALDDAMLVA